MRTSAAAGGLGAIVFGVGGLASTALQLAQQTLGFADTDSPAVTLAYLRDHPDNYVQQGLVLFVMAIALTIVVFVAWDTLSGRSGSLGLRTVSAFGLFAAACLFLFGVLRYGVRPLLHIDSLELSWGEAAYLVQQIAGVHGVAAGAIVAACGWAVGTAVLGYRSRALPRWLALLAIIPAFRLLTFFGPLLPPELPLDALWIVLMLSIPGTMAWFVALGAVLLRRGLRAEGGQAAVPVGAGA